MRFRRLRIAWSVFFGIVVALLVVLWVGSYESEDYLQSHLMGTQNLVLTSIEGRVNLTFLRIANGKLPWSLGSKALGDWPAHQIPLWPQGSQFGLKRELDHFDVVAPHWFFVLMLATFAGVPWIRPSSRFSLRTLLIAVTLGCLGLGLVVWLIR